ncbi:MAG: hypothetical protein NVSMB20_17400 [Bradyrhizobium sp.]
MSADFGANFREARVRAGLTQAEVAEQCGMKQSYISNIERGTQENLELSTMARLAHVVGADLRRLLG